MLQRIRTADHGTTPATTQLSGLTGLGLLVLALMVTACGGGGSSSRNHDSSAPPLILRVASEPMQVQLHWENHGDEPVSILYSSDPDCDWSNPGSCAPHGRPAITGVTGDHYTLRAIPDGMDPDIGWFFVVEQGSRRSEVIGGRPFAPMPSGGLSALTVHNDRLYVGGFFQSISMNTPGGAMLDSRTGELSGAQPDVTSVAGNANISVAIADGAGGWYVAGHFDVIGGEPRRNLARLRANGSIDPDWRAETNDWVSYLAVHDGKVYAGGGFDQANDQPRQGLAAFDANTGLLDPAWQADIFYETYDLVPFGNHVYINGYLSGQYGNGGLFAVDAETGELNPSLTIAANSWIGEVLLVDDMLYFGGAFTEVAGEHREHLAAIRLDGSLDPHWMPSTDQPVSTLTYTNGKIYASGEFTEVSGESRPYLAAVDALTGDLDPDWAPAANHSAFTLTAINDTVYASFRVDPNEPPTALLAAFDAKTGQQDDLWQPIVGYGVSSLSPGNGTLYATGWFTFAGGERRQNLAAFDANNGTLDPHWNPGVDSAPEAIAASDDVVYVGGAFTEIASQAHSFLAALDASTGTPIANWQASVTDRVRTLSLVGDTLYAGGDFQAAQDNPQGPHYLASFDALTGVHLSNWRPQLSGSAHALYHANAALYVTGTFQEAGGEPRAGQAAFALDDGELDLSWAPDLPGSPSSIVVSEDTAYFPGYFQSPEGTLHVAAVDAHGTGTPVSDWQLTTNDFVSVLALSGDTLFIGGRFTEVNDSGRQNLAAVDNVSGEPLTDWEAFIPDQVRVLAADADKVYVGASPVFSQSESPRPHLMVLDAETGEIVW